MKEQISDKQIEEALVDQGDLKAEDKPELKQLLNELVENAKQLENWDNLGDREQEHTSEERDDIVDRLVGLKFYRPLRREIKNEKCKSKSRKRKIEISIFARLHGNLYHQGCRSKKRNYN